MKAGTTGSFEISRTSDFDPETMMSGTVFELRDDDGSHYARATKVTPTEKEGHYRVDFVFIERPN